MSLLADLWTALRRGARVRAQRALNEAQAEENRRLYLHAQREAINNLPVVAEVRESRMGKPDFNRVMEALKRREDLSPQTKRMLVESLPIDPDWMTPWQDWLNSLRFDGWWPVITGLTGRKEGSAFPFFRSEQELMILRDISRALVTTNNHASGMTQAFKSFVVGTGYKITVTDKDGQNPDLQAQAQAFYDEFARRNFWGERQQELFTRSLRDGESILRVFRPAGESKIPVVRFVWPEQLKRPQDSDENWYYGVHTHPDDIETVISYAVHNLDGSTRFEDVPACDILHIKRNVDSGVKRGVPDFVWGMKDALEQAGKLERNLGEGSAIQAAIAYIMQYEMGMPSEISASALSQGDYTMGRPFQSNPTRSVQQYEAGMIVHTSKNEKFVASPYNAGVAGHLQVVTVLLRGAAVRWNAPEWICSADASNNNYAGQLVAEAPFTKRCESEQEFYLIRLHNFLRRVAEIGIELGALPPNLFDLVELKLEATSPAVRDKLKEAQTDQIHVGMGAKSPQQVTREIGGKPEEVAKEIAEAPKPGGGAPGAPPGSPPPGGGAPPGGPDLPPPPGGPVNGGLPPALGESIFNSLWAAFRTVMEDRAGLVQKQIVNKDGHKQTVWVKPDGADVHTLPAGGANPPTAGQGGAPTSHDAAFSEVEAALPPEAKAPGVLAKVKGLFGRLREAAHVAAIKVALAVHDLAPDILDTAADYSKIFYAGGKAIADPISANLGIGPNTFAVIASHVLGRASVWLRGGAKGAAKTESVAVPDYDALADGVLKVFAELHSAVGGDGMPLPEKDEIVAWLKTRGPKQESILESEYSEDDHPRDEHGKFIAKSEIAAAAADPAKRAELEKNLSDENKAKLDKAIGARQDGDKEKDGGEKEPLEKTPEPPEKPATYRERKDERDERYNQAEEAHDVAVGMGGYVPDKSAESLRARAEENDLDDFDSEASAFLEEFDENAALVVEGMKKGGASDKEIAALSKAIADKRAGHQKGFAALKKAASKLAAKHAKLDKLNEIEQEDLPDEPDEPDEVTSLDELTPSEIENLGLPDEPEQPDEVDVDLDDESTFDDWDLPEDLARVVEPPPEEPEEQELPDEPEEPEIGGDDPWDGPDEDDFYGDVGAYDSEEDYQADRDRFEKYQQQVAKFDEDHAAWKEETARIEAANEAAVEQHGEDLDAWREQTKAQIEAYNTMLGEDHETAKEQHEAAIQGALDEHNANLKAEHAKKHKAWSDSYDKIDARNTKINQQIDALTKETLDLGLAFEEDATAWVSGFNDVDSIKAATSQVRDRIHGDLEKEEGEDTEPPEEVEKRVGAEFNQMMDYSGLGKLTQDDKDKLHAEAKRLYQENQAGRKENPTAYPPASDAAIWDGAYRRAISAAYKARKAAEGQGS